MIYTFVPLENIKCDTGQFAFCMSAFDPLSFLVLLKMANNNYWQLYIQNYLAFGVAFKMVKQTVAGKKKEKHLQSVYFSTFDSN